MWECTGAGQDVSSIPGCHSSPPSRAPVPTHSQSAATSITNRETMFEHCTLGSRTVPPPVQFLLSRRVVSPRLSAIHRMFKYNYPVHQSPLHPTRHRHYTISSRAELLLWARYAPLPSCHSLWWTFHYSQPPPLRHNSEIKVQIIFLLHTCRLMSISNIGKNA